MSKSFVYRRFEVCSDSDGYVRTRENDDPEGAYVRAQDALDREAVLQAQIRTLETQLRDSRMRLNWLLRGTYLSGCGWTVARHATPIAEYPGSLKGQAKLNDVLASIDREIKGE